MTHPTLIGTALAVLLSGGCAGSGEGATWAYAAPGVSPGGGAATPLGKAGCVPNCRGKTCGHDGCGGQCGRCGPGKLCLADRCVKNAAAALCRLVTGRWKGVMQARPLHYLDGRIFFQGKTCRGRFRVSYRLPSGPAWVMQEFVIKLSGTYMRMIGVRISSKSSNSNYNLDRFAGRLTQKHRRFSGRNNDVKGSVSPFYMIRK